jgi:hypothetical protein
MNSKGSISIVAKIVIVLVVLGILISVLAFRAAPAINTMVECPGHCVKFMDGCQIGESKIGYGKCEKIDKSDAICCASPSELGKAKKPAATTGTTPGTTTETTTEASIVIHRGADETTNLDSSTPQSLTAGIQNTFTIWVTGKNTVCSVKLLSMPDKNQIKDAAIFSPVEVLNQDCAVANKKVITITLPQPAATGSQYKMDVVVYKGTTAEASKAIIINSVANVPAASTSCTGVGGMCIAVGGNCITNAGAGYIMHPTVTCAKQDRQ